MKPVKPTMDGESLLDEADFLGEIEKLEDGMTAERRSPDPMIEPNAAVRTTPLGKFADDPVPAKLVAPVSVSRAAVVGFLVLMTAVGAAGAILVFHDRVAQFLSRIQ